METDDNAYFFAMNIDILKGEDGPKRMVVTRAILKSLGTLPGS